MFSRRLAVLAALVATTLATAPRLAPVARASQHTLSVPMVFTDGEAAPGLARYAYTFAIPALQLTSKGSLLAFAQANLVSAKDFAGGSGSRVGSLGHSHTRDGRGAWTDIVVRRSTDGGKTWGALQTICRNSTLNPDGTRDRCGAVMAPPTLASAPGHVLPPPYASHASALRSRVPTSALADAHVRLPVARPSHVLLKPGLRVQAPGALVPAAGARGRHGDGQGHPAFVHGQLVPAVRRVLLRTNGAWGVRAAMCR